MRRLVGSAAAHSSPTGSGILLGFDFGERRIGVAVGQLLTQTATPIATLISRDAQPDWDAIEALIAEWRPSALVVGRPARHEPDVIDERIAAFCRKLRGRFNLPVHTVNEAYTSVEARARIRGLRAQGARRRTVKGDIDQLAAALLLEAWMASEGETGHGD